MDVGGLANLRRGTVEFCVLALLRERQRYAVELAQELVPAGLLASEGTLYPLLSRLRRDGLVESRWEESVAGAPRRYYGLSDLGLRALKGFADEWRPVRDAVDDLMGRAA